jgi:hypothetical protein
VIKRFDPIDLALFDAPQRGVEHLQGTRHPERHHAVLDPGDGGGEAYMLMAALPQQRGDRRSPDSRPASVARHAPNAADDGGLFLQHRMDTNQSSFVEDAQLVGQLMDLDDAPRAIGHTSNCRRSRRARHV